MAKSKVRSQKSEVKTNGVVEQLIRPTGILDPEIEIRKTDGQINDLIIEIGKRIKVRQRVLVTTLTKRLAEDLTNFLSERSIKVAYIHSDVKTLERTDLLDDLRRGKYDVLVGINLLREGLDLPEVSLVAILDADKEGFLRSKTSLIQTMGRAARHVSGKVILYAQSTTGSMKAAIAEVSRRREIQRSYNLKHGLKARSIKKAFRNRLIAKEEKEKPRGINLKRSDFGLLPRREKRALIGEMEARMKESADNLDFETAAYFRDQVRELRRFLAAEVSDYG